MKGPPPKDPKTRQRRNKATTAKQLVTLAGSAPRARAPRLPAIRDWDKMTRQWWGKIWKSPMAAEYLDSDIDGLLILAVLVDKFWKNPTKAMAAEIRLQGQNYGITPLDRRRLEWQVIQTEESADRRERNRARRAVLVEDPRGVLD